MDRCCIWLPLVPLPHGLSGLTSHVARPRLVSRISFSSFRGREACGHSSGLHGPRAPLADWAWRFRHKCECGRKQMGSWVVGHEAREEGTYFGDGEQFLHEVLTYHTDTGAWIPRSRQTRFSRSLCLCSSYKGRIKGQTEGQINGQIKGQINGRLKGLFRGRTTGREDSIAEVYSALGPAYCQSSTRATIEIPPSSCPWPKAYGASRWPPPSPYFFIEWL